MFSRRSAHSEATTPFAELIAQCRAEGRVRFDLTQTNPTRVGLPYDAVGIGRALGTANAHDYAPECLGDGAARRAIAELWAQRGVEVSPHQIVLTASTSEAYSLLFKLFCDPGSAVLVPTPSYPLFAELARYDDVELIPYPLAYDGAWHIDREALERAFSARVRAVITVSPNNPTGSCLTSDDVEVLSKLGVPIISDEVFWAYPLELPSSLVELVPPSSGPSSAAAGAVIPGSVPVSSSRSGVASEQSAPGSVNRNPRDAVASLFNLLPSGHSPVAHASGADVGEQHRELASAGTLVVALDGLSKYAALPGLKLGWVTLGGDPALVADALGRLEFILDAYLSVNAPVQRALPELLRISAPTRIALRQRLLLNLGALDRRLDGTAITRFAVQAGWAVVLRVPRVIPELEWVTGLLETEGVLVQPGLFYDFEVEGTLVLSLLPEPESFDAGVERLVQYVRRVCG